MAIKQEMFRFVSTRRVERAIMSRIASRLIRDRRKTTRSSMLFKLFGPGLYETQLVTANTFAASADFLAADDPTALVLETVAAFFRERLTPGVVIADFAAEFKAEFPVLSGLLAHVPPASLVERTSAMNAKVWDSFYAQTIRGCDRYVSTNYLADGLRVYHVFRLLWMSQKLKLTTWAGVTFDEYDTLIDLKAALLPDEGEKPDVKPVQAHPTKAYEDLRDLTQRLTQIDLANDQLGRLVDAQATQPGSEKGTQRARLNTEAAKLLGGQPALGKVDLAVTPVDEIRKQLRVDRELTGIRQEIAFNALVDPDGAEAVHAATSQALALHERTKSPAASLANLTSPGGVFRVPLSVGEMKPPAVGDLLIVEQELRRYELGELARIDTIMRGERRERTIRQLNRTSQTTTTESSFEQEESSSLKTDERFQLSSQAQQSAEQSFGVQAGVNVSGKFGPVQVSASVNASFDTSKSSSESTSQEYAKTVTEEATKRVKSSIKESSSITILTETQDTTLQGFNNEKGATHVNGLYRWVDKIYDAQLVNYGRRLMFSLNVPEPAAFYRGLITQNEKAATADLVEPVHPSEEGFDSFKDIEEINYAWVAGMYEASVQPPPPQQLTGSKAFVYPDAMQAGEIKVHDAVNDLSYVASDNTLTLDPGYRLLSVAVHAPVGSEGGHDSYVNALKLGQVAAPSVPKDGTTVAEANLLLVQVADKSFFMSVRRDPDNGDKQIVKTNFNESQTIDSALLAFGDLVQPTIPVTITANFEGVFTFTVSYVAYRTDEAYDLWKANTYAAILKAYNTKKQAYDQAKAIAESKAQSAVESKTFALRDDQYRSIELTELKRGCIDLLSEGTATGYTSITVAKDGTPDIVHDPAEGALLNRWRSPLANGSVAEFFELAFEWENTTYQFHPYYWAGRRRWENLAQASGADPVFEQFLRAGNANVVVPVRPGYERTVIFFLKTGLIWGGGYLSLFTSQDMLDVYADVEMGRQFDPPLDVGDPWEIRLPSNMVMLQEDDTLPEFPPDASTELPPSGAEPVPDETVPF
jgi:hypothetical protein